MNDPKRRQSDIFSGLDDTPLFPEDEVEGEKAEGSEDFDQQAYDEFIRTQLEDNLHNPAGYGKKLTEGNYKPCAEEMADYNRSSYRAYQQQLDETAERIVKLKEKDTETSMRDGFLGMLTLRRYRITDLFFIILWYGLCAGAGAGLGYAMGVRGIYLSVPATLIGIVGSIIMRNGRDDFEMEQALRYSVLQLTFFIASVVVSVLYGLDIRSPFKLVPIGAMICIIGMFVHFKIILGESGKTLRYRLRNIIVILIVLAIAVIVIVITHKMITEPPDLSLPTE